MGIFGTNYCKKKKRGAHNKLDLDLKGEIGCTHIVTNSLKRNKSAKKSKTQLSYISPGSYSPLINDKLSSLVFVTVILTRIQNDTEQNSNIPAPKMFINSFNIIMESILSRFDTYIGAKSSS